MCFLGSRAGRIIGTNCIYSYQSIGVFKMGFLWLNPIGAFGVIFFSFILKYNY